MRFTSVIFNTYGFLLESAAKAKLAPPFLMLKNSLWYSHCANIKYIAKQIFSPHAPLKIYLLFKFSSRSLDDNMALPFQLLIHNSIFSSCLMIESNSNTQG